MSDDPSLREIDEAKKHPNGWLYRIASSCGQTANVAPEAIQGAWKVDEAGRIEGAFISNPKYNKERWP